MRPAPGGWGDRRQNQAITGRISAIMANAYDVAYRRSLEDPDGFWGEVAQDIKWIKKWDKVLDDSRKSFDRGFRGGGLTTCYNALARHVEEGRADQVALIYDSPVTGNTVKKFTYRQLKDEVGRFAGALV